MRHFKGFTRLDENAIFCALACANHDGDRRGKTERTGAGDDEDGDGDGESKLQACPRKKPDHTDDDSNRDDHRNKDARDFIRHACNRCLRCARFIDQANDLTDGRILADARRTERDVSILDDGRTCNICIPALFDRNALARDRRSIDARRTLCNHTVRRDALAGANADEIADRKLFDGNGDFIAAADDMCRPRRELLQ